MIKMDFSKFRYEVSLPAEPASELILQCDFLAARITYLEKILKENGIDFD